MITAVNKDVQWLSYFHWTCVQLDVLKLKTRAGLSILDDYSTKTFIIPPVDPAEGSDQWMDRCWIHHLPLNHCSSDQNISMFRCPVNRTFERRNPEQMETGVGELFFFIILITQGKGFDKIFRNLARLTLSVIISSWAWAAVMQVCVGAR